MNWKLFVVAGLLVLSPSLAMPDASPLYLALDKLPVQEKADVHEITKNLQPDKCATNVSEYQAALKSGGYEILIESLDKQRPYIVRDIYFNSEYNDLAFVSYLFDKTKSMTTADNKPLKACMEFLTTHINYDGKVFKKFVLQQIISQRQMELDQMNAEMEKKRDEEQHHH